ncbi:MAG: hypothetical protein GF309_03380 [Candidatus Lokiarchaeota archaeon]|nr:hypothetical protein [Candidatus Lokiarchaeota archaeon]
MPSWLLVLMSLFSGIGAGFVLHVISLHRERIEKKKEIERRKRELIHILATEVLDNIEKMKTMISDRGFIPYWELSTFSFQAIVSELPSLLKDDLLLLYVLFERYRKYDLINRELNLLHYREEGIKASIYPDSTLPLVASELGKSELALNLLNKASRGIRIEQYMIGSLYRDKRYYSDKRDTQGMQKPDDI